MHGKMPTQNLSHVFGGIESHGKEKIDKNCIRYRSYTSIKSSNTTGTKKYGRLSGLCKESDQYIFRHFSSQEIYFTLGIVSKKFVNFKEQYFDEIINNNDKREISQQTLNLVNFDTFENWQKQASRQDKRLFEGNAIKFYDLGKLNPSEKFSNNP